MALQMGVGGTRALAHLLYFDMVYSDVFGILFSQCGEISKMTQAATQVEGEVISAIDQLAWHDMARRPYC
jgi:hypothetical protein